jgi:hypothetical protein
MIDQSIALKLNEKQLAVFSWLYQDILNNYATTAKNKDISKLLGIPESTLEKYLKLFESIGLIKRSSERGLNYQGRWETISRSITLNPDVFPPKILTAMRQANTKAIVDKMFSLDITSEYISTLKNRVVNPSSG